MPDTTIIQQIADLTDAYRNDVENITSQFEQELQTVKEEAKDTIDDYAGDLTERTQQYIADIKALFQPRPEPGGTKNK